ncbi:MAG TPA: DUF3300 domain-containing protein [Terriglobales bacterium]|jgi:hypothetical protein|nr:DUF3300 domain-containing protein [Terriglobales bacterium]
MIKKTLGSDILLKLPQKCMAVLCSALLVPGLSVQANQSQAPAAGTAQQEAANLSPDQLDSLVAPIALYPDPLLAQVLAASTYPLELVQLQQWLEKNKTLKDKALVDAVQKQSWDPSVQAMAALPDVVKRLVDDIQWTADLGNAFLAQQDDVMGAVQRMRAKAQEKGNLKSNEQIKVETRVVESKQVIVVEQSNPQVVYVPSYDPVVVYGPPAYPYPPIYYPPPGYYAAGMAISFGVGLAIGAAWGGGWGYNCGWGGGNNNININNNNNFINNSNRQNIGNGNRPSQQPSGGRGNSWQHNPQHRGGTPYGNRATANKYGGTTRGASASDRQANARRQQSRQQGGRQGAGTMDRGGAGGGRQQGGAGNRGSGGDRVGNRQTSGGSGGRNSGAFGGSSRSGSSARASSSRGGSSMGGGSRGGGGGRRR